MLKAWLRALNQLYGLPLTLALIALALARVEPTGWALFNMAVWPLISFGSIAFHELGHAVAGKLVGLKPRVIQVGMGRELLRRQLGGLEVRLHSLPLLGLTYLSARELKRLRFKMFVAIAAGPLATAGLFAFLAGVQPSAPIDSLQAIVTRPAIVEIALFWNAIALLTSAIPVTLSSGFRTDGRLLLAIPWMKEAHLAEMLTVDLLLDVQAAIERHDLAVARRCLDEILAQNPSAFAARSAQAAIELEAGDFVRARELLTALRAEPPPDEPSRLVLVNNLAWAHFLSEEPAHLEEAETLSREVWTAMSSAPFALGTRGAVLTWLGRLDEACELLEKAHLNNSSHHSRALNACCLAMAWAKRNNLIQAKTWLETAARDDAGCMLLPRARAAVSAIDGA